MRTAMTTATTVTISSSIESAQNPKSPNDAKDAATRIAMRQFATAYPIQVATASTPSQPTCGTGRGKSGTAIIRESQPTASTNQCPTEYVACTSGLVSRLASTESRNS